MNWTPLALVATAALALAWSPIPDFPEDRVAVAVDPDSFDDLSAFLAGFTSAVGADYQVAVVENSDPDDRVGPEWGDESGAYADAFAAAWGPSYDLSRGVLVILALQNREVIVQPGADWIALGWEDAHVAATIDGSEFADHARAGDYSGALEALIEQIDRELDRRQRSLAESRAAAADRIAEAQRFHAELSQRIVEAGMSSERIDEAMHEGLARIQDASVELDRGNEDLAKQIAIDAASTMAVADARLQGMLNDRRLVRVTLPLTIALILFVGLLIAASSRKRARSDLRDIATRRISEWQARLGHASVNLIDLEERHPLLLGRDDLDSWFKGESEVQVKQAARRVDDLFLAFEVCTSLVAAAEQLVEDCGFPRISGFRRAIDTLGTDEVIARTEDVKKRRLFLPDKREIRMPAAELLHLMDREYGSLVAEIERVETEFTAAWDSVDAIEPALVEAAVAQQALHDRGMRIAVLDQRLERTIDQFQTLRGEAQRDPLSSRVRSTALADRVAELDDTLDVAAGAWVELVDTSRPVLATLTTRVASLRADEGYLLVEPGFEPDILLADARAAHDTAVEALTSSLVELGDSAASDLADAVAELAALLDDVETAREEGAAWIESARVRALMLEDQLPTRTERIESLRDIHADGALQPALDNAEQAAAALGFTNEALDEASTAFHAQVQRYLAGTELVERARDALNAVESLYAEVEAKADALARAQTQADERGADLAELVNELSDELAEPAPFATAATLAGFVELQRLEREQVEARAHKRPNWLLCAENAAELLAAGRALEARSEQEKADFVASKSLLAQAGRLKTSAGALLDSSEDDRGIANQRMEEAIEALANANRVSEGERPAWGSVRSWLERAIFEFNAATAAARADIDAAAAARSEIQSAQTAIADARSQSPAGRPAKLGTAEAELKQAQTALTADDYAEARRHATTARGAANNALQDAKEAQRKANARRARQATTLLSSSRPRRHGVASWSGASRRSSTPSWGSTRRSSSGFGGSRRSSSFGSSRSTSFSKPSSSRRSSGRSSFKKASGRGKF